MKRMRALLALTALATSSLFALAPAAHAETNGVSDPRGDSTSPHSDIITMVDTYGNGLVGLGLGVVSPEDPNSAYDWTSHSTFIIWTLHTPNGDFDVHYADYGQGVEVHVYPSNDSTKICDGTPDYNGTSYMAFLPADCIGHPAWFSLQGFIYFDNGSANYDFAPTYNTFGGLVHETIDSTTTTTTQPTTTTTQPTTTTTQPIGAHDAGSHDGYWMVDQSGTVYGFGTAKNLGGSTGGVPFVHIEPTPSGNGYWLLDASGAIHTLGDAVEGGSINYLLKPGEVAVSLSATPTGHGYWIFTDKGRVITSGDAVSYGDMSGTKLSGPVLGSVATPSGKGYWMVASDGGIFAFGDAAFHGSTGNIKLNKPVMSMAPAPDGSGYWLVASDGGVFAFDVPFYGSMGSTPLNKPISGMVPGRAGYMMVGQDGGIFSFGSVAFHGSLGANPPATPVVSVALQP